MGVKGLQQVLNNLKNAEEIIKDDVRDVIEKYVLIIQREAIRNAPGAGDQVPTTYGTQKIETGINQYIFAAFDATSKGMTGTVGIEAGATELAIYIEFGTGASAANYVPTLEPAMQAIAQKYYKNGKGTLIKQPFLLPAFYANQFKFLKELQQVLASHGIPTKLLP